MHLGYGNYPMKDCFVYNTTYEFDLLQKPVDNYPHFRLFFVCKFKARKSSGSGEEACRKLRGFVL